jgi:hypothetical protein
MLQIDRNHTAIQLSLEADRLCRLRQYQPAIDVAASATQLVRTDPWLLGETLLYLSYARLCSDLPEQITQAARDCDRAIRALGLSTYNYAIANLIRGQMDLQINGVTGRSNALRYFQRASEVLEKQRSEESQYNRVTLATRCSELKVRADQQIKQLAQKMTASQAVKIPPKQRSSEPQPKPAQAEPLPYEVPVKIPRGDGLISKRLVWPPQEPPLIFDSPPAISGALLDFLGIRQLSLRNRVYDVLPLVGDEPVHLRPRQNYWIVPIEGAPRGELALVREQVRPDQAEQFIAVGEPTQQRVWIDKAEFSEGLIHILGAERTWQIRDNVDRLDISEPHLIGIVEAILMPAAAKTA